MYNYDNKNVGQFKFFIGLQLFAGQEITDLKSISGLEFSMGNNFQIYSFLPDIQS